MRAIALALFLMSLGIDAGLAAIADRERNPIEITISGLFGLTALIGFVFCVIGGW